MCHLDDQDNMLVDKTWGIMPLSGRCPSSFKLCSLFLVSYVGLTVSYCSLRPSRGYS